MNKIIIFSFLILFHAGTAKAEVSAISELKWQSRVVIYVADENDHVEALLSSAEKHRGNLLERKLTLLILKESTLFTFPDLKTNQALVSSIQRSKTSEKTVLIGLDGGIKHSYNEINWPLIFSHIDAMPMRMAELNRR